MQVLGSTGTVYMQLTASGALTVPQANIRAQYLTASDTATSSIVSNATVGHVVMKSATTTPNTPSGGGVAYVNSGALTYMGTGGVARTVVAADGTVTEIGRAHV